MRQRRFYFTFIYSLMLFLSSWRSEFLAYIIFFLSEKLFLTFLTSWIYTFTNFLNFCLSEKVFIFSCLLKDSFTAHRILGWCFYLSILNISLYFLLTSMVFEEKSHTILILLLHKKNVFLLAFFRIFFPWFSLNIACLAVMNWAFILLGLL